MLNSILDKVHRALSESPRFTAYRDDNGPVSSYSVAQEIEEYQKRARKCIHITGNPPTYTGFKFCPKCGEEL